MNRLAADQRGVIIIMFALMVPIFLGFIGLGVEVGYWFQKHRDLQAAADAAAVAAAYENAEGRSSGVQTIAEREAGNNGWNSTDGTITVRSVPFNSTFPASGSFTTDTDAVEIELTYSLDRLFSSWFLSGDMIINARAVGDVVAGASDACLLALGSGNLKESLYIHGGATVTMSGCTAATNSTNAAAVQTTSGLTVDCIYSSGGVNGTTDPSAAITPTPVTTECSGSKLSQPTVSDPYDVDADLTKPGPSEFSGCSTYSSPVPPADDSLSAGVFCGIDWGLANKTLTLSAGIYYIDQGDLDLNANNAVIDGTAGVTIVFGDSTGTGNCGSFKLVGGSLNITAPTTGNFAGLALYRNSECDAAEDFDFGGNNDSAIIGAIYNPSAGINMTGTGSITSTCLQIIADTINITGDGSFGSTCAGTGVKTVSAGGIGSLVE